MKHFILITAAVFTIQGLFNKVNGQINSSKTKEGVVLSAGIESGISTGTFRNDHKWSLGGSLQAELPVADPLYVIVNAGYDNFRGNDHHADLNWLPAMAGVKFFPLSNCYVQAAAGAGFALNKADVNYQRTAAFLYVPQIGIQLPLDGRNFIDAGVRYEGTTSYIKNESGSKLNSFSLRVAYAFCTK